MSSVFDLNEGQGPLLVSFPHSGTGLAGTEHRLSESARMLPDTDWHLPQLYGFLSDMDVTTIVANHSRFVVDLNRDPGGTSLYPGQNVTELVPTTLFDETPVYKTGQEPGTDEISERVKAYHAPYHRMIKAQLDRIRTRHGFVILWDAHSIKSRVPRFFDGQLPDLNIGTNGGKSCGTKIHRLLLESLADIEDYSSIMDGRFRGGYITRHYGCPWEHIHTIQLELSQITYMDETPPFDYCPEKAAKVAEEIEKIVRRLHEIDGTGL